MRRTGPEASPRNGAVPCPPIEGAGLTPAAVTGPPAVIAAASLQDGAQPIIRDTGRAP